MEFDKFLSHVCYAVRGAATARGRSPYQDRAPSALQLFCPLLLPELKNITDIYVRKKISKLGLFIGCKHWFHDLLCTEEEKYVLRLSFSWLTVVAVRALSTEGDNKLVARGGDQKVEIKKWETMASKPPKPATRPRNTKIMTVSCSDWKQLHANDL